MTRLFISAIQKKPGADGRGGYPFSLPAVKSLSKLSLSAPVTFFVGENGTGKSTLLEAIAVNSGFNAEGGSQFIIATHSPILLAYPGAQIYVLTESGIELTPYKETEHYAITKEFLNNPNRMLDRLLED